MATAQSGYRIIPLRDHNDMLVKAQFVVPDFKDGERLCTRVKINLLYYQTNYFLFLIVWPYAFGAMMPEYYIYGLGAVLILPILLLILAADNIRPSAVSSQTVGLCLGATWTAFCWALGLVPSVCYFLVSVIIPLSAILAHASARYTNRQDTYHFHASPMSQFLGFRASKQAMTRPPSPPSYQQVRPSTLPRRSNNHNGS